MIHIVLCENCKTIQRVGSKCGICGKIVEKREPIEERSEKDESNQEDIDELKEKKS